VGRIKDFLTGKDLVSQDGSESRTLAPPPTRPGCLPWLTSAPLDVTESNWSSVSDAWACVRLLSDSVASLPPHVYRKTDAGRVEAGPDSRLRALLQTPSPGSTSADLFSQAMTHLCVNGNAFVGKFRGGDGAIVQLGLLDPQCVEVELRGQTVVYTITLNGRRSEHGPDDILHIKGMSADGLRGLSPIGQCATALGLSSSLQQSAKVYTEQGSRPSGILSTSSLSNSDAVETLSARWSTRHGGVANMHRVAVLTGDVKFTPVAFSADDSQFLQQRELSAREVARIFRVPAHFIDAASGDSLTYSNALDRNRHFLDYSLTPWLVRIERAFSNDSDLCPGATYLQFSVDGFLRADAATRSDIYTKALNADTGWMTRAEVRELEDLSPEEDVAPPEAAAPPAPPENGAPNVA
jgi:HK97 family phage portal protein